MGHGDPPRFGLRRRELTTNDSLRQSIIDPKNAIEWRVVRNIVRVRTFQIIYMTKHQAMNRRKFLALSASAVGIAVQPKRRPNILLIVADDLGYSDLGCFGGEIDTPNLNQLASRGSRFSQLYSTARCCPSRASILTGQYSHKVGIGHMVSDLGQPGYRGRL